MTNAAFDKAALAATLPWDADWVTAVTFIGQTRRVAAGNNLGEIMLWDLPEKFEKAPPKPVRKLQGHSNVITRLLSTADGKWLISSSNDHSIRLWDMQESPKGTAEVVLNARAIYEAQTRKNGPKPPAPNVAKVELQSAVQILDNHKEWVGNICLSKDEKFMLSGDDAGEVIFWNFPERKEIRRWKTKGWVYGLGLSPDAKLAVVAERKPLIFDSGRMTGLKLWNVETGQVVKDLDADYKGMHICAAVFSLDGKTIAIGRGGESGEGPTGKLWLLNAADGKKIKELTPPHSLGVTDLVFHPDGKHLASAGRDTLVRLWDIADGKMLKQLGKERGGQFKDWICATAFSRDGKWIAGADMAGSVLVWSLT